MVVRYHKVVFSQAYVLVCLRLTATEDMVEMKVRFDVGRSCARYAHSCRLIRSHLFYGKIEIRQQCE